MATQLDIMQAGQDWAGQPMAIATVVNAWGSAPRPRGSHMLMVSDGRFAGSVSGGCVETDVLFHGVRVAAGAPAFLRRYGTTDASLWQAGLPCGGEIEIYIQPVNAVAFMPEIFCAVAHRIKTGEAQIVATDMRCGTSRCVEEPLPDHFNNMYRPPRRMLLVGAVDIAQALSRIAITVGFAVTVIDPRTRFLTRERFDGADLDSRWPDEALRALRPDASTAVVTLSHDAKLDDAALVAALESGAGYVAALGSVRSHAARTARLRLLGLGADAIARIDAPAGLRIGALGPNEIALSIAAGAVGALSRDSLVKARVCPVDPQMSAPAQ